MSKLPRLPFLLVLTIGVPLLLWGLLGEPRGLFISVPCPPLWTPSRANFSQRPVMCDQAFEGNKEEIAYAGEYKWCTDLNRVTDERYMELTKNCDDFKARFGYLDYHIAKEEEEFPIAFSILMYDNLEQAERLLRMIYRPQNLYCIHVDTKASAKVQAAVRAITSCFHNVMQPEKQVSVRWAEFTVVEAELMCMEALWQASDKWKYFINLTGREFPLKTNWELVQILKAYNGANDVSASAFKRPLAWTKYSWWTEYWRTNTLKDPAPHKFLIHKGSAHIAVVRDFVGWVLHDERAVALRDWMRDIRVPDEHFFNTLSHNAHMNIPGAYTGNPDLKPFYTRLKIWQDVKGENQCHGRWVRFLCHLGTGDLSQITGHKEMFVNKFDIIMDPVAIACAEQWYRNRTQNEGHNTDFDPEFYRKLRFVKNHV